MGRILQRDRSIDSCRTTSRYLPQLSQHGILGGSPRFESQLSHFLNIFSIPLPCNRGWLHTVELIAPHALGCGTFNVTEIAAAKHASFQEPTEIA